MMEDQSKTQVSKHTLLCAATLIAIMGAGAWQIIGAIQHPDGLDYPKGTKHFREGVLTQALEKQLDKKLPHRDQIIAFANSIKYSLLRGGSDQVIVGKDDWLFLTDEVRYELDNKPSSFNNPSESFQARIALISAVSKRLEKQGVKMLVALVPDKARVYEQKLPTGKYPIYNQSKYAQALSALTANGVSVVNLLDSLKKNSLDQETYYRTDTHWNQHGALLAAQQIGQANAKLSLQLPASKFTSQTQGGVQERSGDLLRLMGLEKVPNVLRPLPDSETPILSKEVSEAKEANATKQAGLFDEGPKLAVVLTGTSYSLRGNFHGYLQQELQSKVLNTAKDGGGFLQGLTAYLKDESFKQSKPQLLVWELPERMLNSQLKEEKTWLKDMAAVLPE